MFLTTTATVLQAEPFNTHSFSSETKTGISLSGKGYNGFMAVSTLSYVNLSQVSSPQGTFAALDTDGYTPGKGVNGTPLVPVLERLIEIPQNATVEIRVQNIEEQTLELNEKAGGLKLAPRQKPRIKSRSSAEQPFIVNKKAYTRNTFDSTQRIGVDILGGMRGSRVARLTVRPFRYNPSSNVLKVATRISFRVVFKNGDMARTRKIRAKYTSPLFKSAYDTLINYPVSGNSKDALITDNRTYPLTYVVVASDDFLESDSLKEFIQWKRDIGFHVIEADTHQIYYPSGVTYLSKDTKRKRIQAYLKDLYDNGNHPPSYVLLVGDSDDIPPFETEDHVTDLYYFTFSGGFLPEAYYGRFPAESQSELDRIVAKTLSYEQSTRDSGSYLGQALVIAGADQEYSPTYANGQVAYLINEYLNTGSGYSHVYAYLYNTSWTWDGITTGTTGSTLITTAIKSRFNQGIGFVNYSGHCGVDGWWNGDADAYEFDSDDITSLTNDDEYPFVVGNCCESSRFEENNPDSFGERMVLASGKGAVAYIGASDFTFWDEDFYWALGYKDTIGTMTESETRNLDYGDTDHGNFDALWHTHGEDDSDWYVTTGQMIYRGNLSVLHTSSAWDSYYFEVYNLMGDPSLMPYLRIPQIIPDPTVSSDITPCSTKELDITTVPYAQVALLQNGELAASAFSGSSGSVSLSFAPFDNGDEAELVVSKQNHQIKRWRDIEVTGLSGMTPVADFVLGKDTSATVVEVTSGVPMTFTNLSTGCPNSFSWIFEQGTPGTSQDKNPTVTYNVPGYFDVQLTAINGKGSETLVKANYIHVVPGINFSADQTRVPYGTVVTFTDLSSNSPTAWAWEFQGGTPPTSTLQNPMVTYAVDPGSIDPENPVGSVSYPVKLTVTIDGTTHSLTRDAYITVTAHKPVTGFTANVTTVKGGEPVVFTSTSTNNPSQLYWNFSGGSPASSIAETPTVTYAKKGTYNVVLVATNDGGSDTLTRTGYITVTEDAPVPPTQGVEENDGGCFIRSSRWTWH